MLDLSTYETYLNQLKQQTDPEGYEKEKAEKKKEQAEKSSLELTAPGVRIEDLFYQSIRASRFWLPTVRKTKAANCAKILS